MRLPREEAESLSQILRDLNFGNITKEVERLLNILRDSNFWNITDQELFEARVRNIPVLLSSVSRFQCNEEERVMVDEVVRKYAVRIQEQSSTEDEQTILEKYRGMLLQPLTS